MPFQPLLKYPYMQEFLADASTGGPSYYPAPNPKTSARRALCSFLSDYGVGAVLFWDQGVHPKKVKRLFLEDLGNPASTSKNGKIQVWVTGPHSCTS
jgi:hypothetical protein